MRSASSSRPEASVADELFDDRSAGAYAREGEYPAVGNSDIRELAPGFARSKSEGAPSRFSGVALTNAVNKAMVSLYKIVGFSLLGIILFGLLAYVGLNALFFLHTRWVAPAIIAQTDPRVLELRTRLAQELWNRQRIEVERAQVGAQLSHARRLIAMEEQYQATFKDALSAQTSFHRGSLARARSLKAQVEAAAQSLEQATKRFETTQSASLAAAFDAKLIDQEQKATGDFRLAELKASQVTLQGQRLGVLGQVDELSQRVRALGTIVNDPSSGAPSTLEGLELKRSYMNSVVEAQKAQDSLVALQESDAALVEAIRAYDNVIAIIKESPLMLAASAELLVAFVPYENMSNVTAGDPVYGCAASVVWCRRVGRVGEAIEGEIVAKHPVYGTDLRGRFVRIQFDDPSWAKRPVLHVGRAPLWF